MSVDASPGQGGVEAGGETIVRGQNFLVAPRYNFHCDIMNPALSHCFHPENITSFSFSYNKEARQH